MIFLFFEKKQYIYLQHFINQMDIEKLKFPIGKFETPILIHSVELGQYINDIETFPIRLKKEVNQLSDIQLDTPYRPNGWTIRQVVHHCADSHINSFVRFKLALTEKEPTIKPYFEERWAELSDSKTMSIEPSLMMLDGLHKRWVVLLKSLTDSDLEKSFVHPEHGKAFKLKVSIANYAWHCNHHLAHITVLKSLKGWNTDL